MLLLYRHFRLCTWYKYYKYTVPLNIWWKIPFGLHHALSLCLVRPGAWELCDHHGHQAWIVSNQGVWRWELKRGRAHPVEGIRSLVQSFKVFTILEAFKFQREGKRFFSLPNVLMASNGHHWFDKTTKLLHISQHVTCREPNCEILSTELIRAIFSYKIVRSFSVNPSVSRVLCFSVSLPEQEEQEEEVQRMLLSRSSESVSHLPGWSQWRRWRLSGSDGSKIWWFHWGKTLQGVLYPVDHLFCQMIHPVQRKFSWIQLWSCSWRDFFVYVFLHVCSICPAILGDTIKEKLHLQTLCDSAGWLRHFRGLTATAECSKFVVLWNSLGVPKLWSREESEHNTIQEDGMYIMSQMMWNEL